MYPIYPGALIFLQFRIGTVGVIRQYTETDDK